MEGVVMTSLSHCTLGTLGRCPHHFFRNRQLLFMKAKVVKNVLGK